MEYLPKEDVYIIREKMPMTIKGFCKCVHGIKIAVINDDLAPDVMIETVRHEVGHLQNGDLQSEREVRNIELCRGPRAS